MEVSEMRNVVYNINWDKQPSYERRDFKGFNEGSRMPKEVGIVIDNGSFECRAVKKMLLRDGQFAKILT